MYIRYMRYVYCCRFFSLLLGPGQLGPDYQGPNLSRTKNLDGSALAKATSTLKLDWYKEFGQFWLFFLDRSIKVMRKFEDDILKYSKVICYQIQPIVMGRITPKLFQHRLTTQDIG